MEKIIIEKEVPRYEIMCSMFEPWSKEDFGILETHIEVFFNLNNSGTDSITNFLKCEEVAFESVEQIEQLSKKLEMPLWTVVSFYQENGYMGVYNRTGDHALTVKCNNWIRQGRDGYMFVVFSKKQEEINELLLRINQYINHGFADYAVYDVKEGEVVDATDFTNFGDVESEKAFDVYVDLISKEFGIDRDLILYATPHY